MKQDEANKLSIQFVIFPKYITSDFKNGKLSPNEWKLYMWLRLNMNPYGITSTAISAIKDDIFQNVSKNYIQKLLLSLRSKKYLYFKNHQGRRGSFEIRFGDLISPDGVRVGIEHYFDEKKVAGEGNINTKNDSQTSNSLEVGGHKFITQKRQPLKEFPSNSKKSELTSSYNDNKNDKEIDNDTSSTLQKKEKRITLNYEPNNNDEKRCKEIALEVDDKYIDFILSALHHKYGGIEIIEKAFEHFKNVLRIADEKCDDEIKNPPAFFNSCITNAITDNEYEKTRK